MALAERAAILETMKRLLLLAVTLTAISCMKSLEPLPLDVTIETSKPVTVVGDSVEFVVKAQGGSLVGVTIDFGDAATDIFETQGARTASVHFKHPYGTAGSYTVQAAALDAVAGQKSATVQVTIN